jgi:two-component system response regulator YesN
MDGLRERLRRAGFVRRARAYRQTWAAGMRVVDTGGARVAEVGPVPLADDRATRAGCRQLVAESLRWGEGAITEHEPGLLVWAVPLLDNQRLLGGLIAVLPEARVFPAGAGAPALDLRQALLDLRRLAEETNLTNAALLTEHQEHYRREQERAYALHASKAGVADGIATAYLAVEPQLLSALMRNDRAAATGIINRLLVIAYHRGAGRLEELKSHLLELVIAMVRTAVGAGGSSAELLGVNYRALQELGEIDEEERLTTWLVAILNRIMDSLGRGGPTGLAVQLRTAIAFLEAHSHEPIQRDDAARAAFLSPSYFSRQLKAHTGAGFTEHLNRIRIDRASILLRTTDRAIIAVALAVGFADQSYFTKVFRRHLGVTPREYRRQQQGRDRSGP